VLPHLLANILRQIWINWVKLDSVWAKTKNLATPKTFDLLRPWSQIHRTQYINIAAEKKLTNRKFLIALVSKF